MPAKLTPAVPALLHTCIAFSSIRAPRPCIVAKWLQTRGITRTTRQNDQTIPLRKHLKDEAKRKKTEARLSKPDIFTTSDANGIKAGWELTVGVEIHAELNTASKLFSSAPAATGETNDAPNTNVALFDAAMPGSQPQFQRAALLPALRAAIALGCTVQRKSGWDRKHYFHWDQPNGYQITQYYEPFAKDGMVTVGAQDGVPGSDLNGAESISIGIKQIQMEQDTAKTMHHPPSTYHVDLNRAGHPLIEIITLPQIHSPRTAAAVVRKIQAVLESVDACVTGMELGGLRADVNVSVRRRGEAGLSSYGGVTGLGQRTEIKNLSSFAAVENAIIAERDRQITVLEAGGAVEGETRGWTLGATETSRLRGKEGEVDYRYLPDADLPPLIIGADLVEYLRNSLPMLPDATVARVQREYGLSDKDARTLIALDDGERLEFMEETVDLILARKVMQIEEKAKIGKTVGNWVLHELGGLLSTTKKDWDETSISASELADVLVSLQQRQITSRGAKRLLVALDARPMSDLGRGVEQLIDDGNLRLRALSEAGYVALAEQIMAASPQMVAAARQAGQQGKVGWFVGQMTRAGEPGTIEPQKARAVVERLLGL